VLVPVQGLVRVLASATGEGLVRGPVQAMDLALEQVQERELAPGQGPELEPALARELVPGLVLE
jgi:hypothetical protein